MTAIFTLIEIWIILRANNIKYWANRQQNKLDKHVQHIEIDVNLKFDRRAFFFSVIFFALPRSIQKLQIYNTRHMHAFEIDLRLAFGNGGALSTGI